jgi:hypothetical protein
MIKDGKPSLISRLQRRRFTKTFQARISQAVEARARPMKRPRHGRPGQKEKAKVKMKEMLSLFQLCIFNFQFFLYNEVQTFRNALSQRASHRGD